MNDLIVSRIRTYVPLAVGWALAQLAGALDVLHQVGIDVDEGKAAGVAVLLLSGLYYDVARRLEQRFPKLGWLLGSPKQPTYS